MNKVPVHQSVTLEEEDVGNMKVKDRNEKLNQIGIKDYSEGR